MHIGMIPTCNKVVSVAEIYIFLFCFPKTILNRGKVEIWIWQKNFFQLLHQKSWNHYICGELNFALFVQWTKHSHCFEMNIYFGTQDLMFILLGTGTHVTLNEPCDAITLKNMHIVLHYQIFQFIAMMNWACDELNCEEIRVHYSKFNSKLLKHVYCGLFSHLWKGKC